MRVPNLRSAASRTPARLPGLTFGSVSSLLSVALWAAFWILALNSWMQTPVGFEMIDRGIPRHDYLIRDAEGNLIGRVTSGTQSPTLSKGIGLGYVLTGHAALDSEIFIDVREKSLKAKVVKLPFVK